MQMDDGIAYCDFCISSDGIQKRATWDIPTTMGFWAHVCNSHKYSVATPNATKVGFRLSK